MSLYVPGEVPHTFSVRLSSTFATVWHIRTGTYIEKRALVTNQPARTTDGHLTLIKSGGSQMRLSRSLPGPTTFLCVRITLLSGGVRKYFIHFHTSDSKAPDLQIRTQIEYREKLTSALR